MDYPNLQNINVYQYRNVFDYTRWTDGTRIKICNVPWCGDYDNVVKFDTPGSRDNWLDGVPGNTITLTSAQRILPNGSIKLPVPFDSLAGYNYLIVDFPMATSAANLIDYETRSAKRRWCFFIQDMVMVAPSTTEAIVALDWWTTFIDDVEISYVQLERGHAPLAAISAAEYLANPIENCDYLLTPDVVGGGSDRVKSSIPAIINDGDMFVCFASTADLAGNWGTKAANTWEVAEFTSAAQDGAPVNIKLHAVRTADYAAFCAAVEVDIPQYVQTVQGIFFLPSKLITTAPAGTVGNVTFYSVAAASASLADIRLSTEQFHYPEEYADLAKLYTFPYARLEITDFDGRKTEVHIEDCGGGIGVRALTNLAFPFVNVETMLQGVGGASSSVSFQTLDAKALQMSGTWYDHLQRHAIPVYAITQGMSRNYDYSTHFTRRQQYDEAKFIKDKSDAEQQQIYDNWLQGRLSQSNILYLKQIAENATLGKQKKKMDDDYTADYNMVSTSFVAQSEQTISMAQNNNTQAIATALVGVTAAVAGAALAPVTGGGSLVASAAALSAVSTGVTSVVGTGLQVAATDFSANLTISTNRTITQASVNQMSAKKGNAKDYAEAVLAITQQYESDVFRETRSSDKTQVDANKSLTNTWTQNAKDLSETGIVRQQSQAELQAPVRFGSNTDASTATTKPLGLMVNIMTQSNAAIRTAGDAFLRYGYTLGQNWQVQDLNVMSKFSYWKCSEIWLSGSKSCIEDAQQRIKEILLAGVTVWRRPEDIGNVSIYENERR